MAYEETAKQHEHGELFHTLQQLKAGDQLLIIVGCEGGFDESEIQELNEMGVKCCSLGNRILRSETAPLYLMSVIGYSRSLQMIKLLKKYGVELKLKKCDLFLSY